MRALLLRPSAAAGSPLLHLSRVLSTLAVARVFIATAALGVTLIGATPLDARFRFVVPLLAAYAALAVTDLVVRRRTRPHRGLSPIVMHVIDLSVAAAATLLDERGERPLLPPPVISRVGRGVSLGPH